MLKKMLMGAAAGCLLGILASYLVPALTLTNGLWSGLFLGAAGAAVITLNLQAMKGQRKSKHDAVLAHARKAGASALDHHQEPALQLKEEVLDISKDRLVTGEVTVHREVVEEEKTVTVPVRREEVVIEMHNDDAEAGDRHRSETLRIPVKEERIDIRTYPVALEEVDVHTRQVQGNEPVTVKLKHEEAEIEPIGQAAIMEDRQAEETRT
ncbi:YsnF/AvaK domain-containing protein [Paenibacillus tarimensis]|uniref:YsnF/AvaK domain-containing protein n=1 Tax=Paenibacillus tarimensis TaxID=416012 RepID=UPI001F186FF2|nr:YsnF/AvaK domain-containing protein [Paenibacillus tarimensis]MCF2944720.1 YsnF/AvaK domain-containing protein [Paenibacillus tarimensis]